MTSEKTIISIDSSELDDFMLCRRRWALRHKYNLQHVSSVYALDRGTLLHTCLSHYYKFKMEGAPEQQAVDNSIELARESSLALEGVDANECIEVYFQFREYCRYYAEQKEEFYPIAVEVPFFKQLYEDETLIIAMQGVIDYIGQYYGTDNKIIMDHKGMSKRTEYSLLRNQFKMYCIAADLDTILVNKVGFQKTLPPAERFTRQRITYYPSQLEEQKEVIIANAKELKIALDADYFPPNFTSCDKYSGCAYQTDYCGVRIEAREYRIGTNLVVGKKWDVGELLEGEKK